MAVKRSLQISKVTIALCALSPLLMQAFRSYLTWKFINKTLVWTSECRRACVRRPTLFIFCFNMFRNIKSHFKWNEKPEKRPRTHITHIHVFTMRPPSTGGSQTLVKMSRAPRRTMINFNFSFYSGWIPFRSVVRLSAGCQSVHLTLLLLYRLLH